ncbi:hypothetical protein [Comamonas serinivorans]|uniref:hypothetical protein n=1 Tax=Comamonas serinivorans TaxID=1082851 RepID=UPI0012F86686|nr:hypothetical protein [Comamonas serinivorans]
MATLLSRLKKTWMNFHFCSDRQRLETYDISSSTSKGATVLQITGGVCDLSKRTYFHQTVSSNTAFTFINPPEDVKIFELEVNHSGGTLSFPGNVRWMGAILPADTQQERFTFPIPPSAIDRS